MSVCQVASVMSDSATLWNVANHVCLSMEFSRQDYQSGLPWHPLGIFPTQGSNHLVSFALAGRFFTTWKFLGAVTFTLIEAQRSEMTWLRSYKAEVAYKGGIVPPNF